MRLCGKTARQIHRNSVKSDYFDILLHLFAKYICKCVKIYCKTQKSSSFVCNCAFHISPIRQKCELLRCSKQIWNLSILIRSKWGIYRVNFALFSIHHIFKEREAVFIRVWLLFFIVKNSLFKLITPIIRARSKYWSYHQIFS